MAAFYPVPKDDPVSEHANPTVHITGHNASGKEYYVSSHQPKWFGDESISMSVLYTTDIKVDMNNDVDIIQHRERMQAGKLGLVHPNGTVLRIVDFAPGIPGVMHQTKSLDYGVVLKGEVESRLGSGEVVIMKEGDVIVQRGTAHAWRNTSETQWARMLFVLQDCQAVVVGGEKLGEKFFEHDIKGLPPSGNDD